MKEKRGRHRAGARRAAAAPGTRRTARPTLLCVDLGNSHTGVGLVTGDRVTRLWRLRSTSRTLSGVDRQLRAVLDAGARAAEPDGVVLCSVVPSMTAVWVRALKRATGLTVKTVRAATLTRMPVRYRDAAAVGADRLANAVGARALYGVPAIVVDLGTATTFDCVSARGEFLGGAIAPGVVVSAEGLAARAGHLPRVTLERPPRALARNTRAALQSGLVLGAAAMIDGLVRRLAKEMRSKPHVVATGGLAWAIARHCETVHHIDEGLTMKGMARVWEEAE